MILGPTQYGVLNALGSHTLWHYTCGWRWGSERNTERVLDSLLKKGLVSMAEEPIGSQERLVVTYRVTKLGQAHIDAIREAEAARKLALR